MSARDQPLLVPDSAASTDGTTSGSAALAGKRANRALLLGAYGVLFLRYNIATFLSAFFSSDGPGASFTGDIVGLIFAAYPLGMTVTSVFAPQVIRRIGTRTAVYLGLVSTAVLTLAFGLGPDLTGASQPLEALFFLTYFFNGLFGAFAETACLILVSARFSANAGAVMASMNTVSTLGCMLGPVLGGFLYELPSDAHWAFRMPFIVCAAIPIAFLPFVTCCIPQEFISAADEEPKAVDKPTAGCSEAEAYSSTLGTLVVADDHAPRQGASAASASASAASASASAESVPLTLSILINLLSIALSGTIVGTLDPTLSWRLSAPPFRAVGARVRVLGWMLRVFWFRSSGECCIRANLAHAHAYVHRRPCACIRAQASMHMHTCTGGHANAHAQACTPSHSPRRAQAACLLLTYLLTYPHSHPAEPGVVFLTYLLTYLLTYPHSHPAEPGRRVSCILGLIRGLRLRLDTDRLAHR